MRQILIFLTAVLLSHPVAAENIDIDDIGTLPCPKYAGWIVQLRGTAQLKNLQPSEVAQIYSIKSFLWGAHLAFPEESYSDFEDKFVHTCLNNPDFPATQIVAFFMLARGTE